MAEKMIEEIKAAELRAGEIASDADLKAAQIVSNAEIKAKEIKAKAIIDAKNEASRIVATAENDGYKIKTKAAAENEVKAEAVKKASEAKVIDAINLVIKEIIPE